jgi:hypothetical protein
MGRAVLEEPWQKMDMCYREAGEGFFARFVDAEDR